MEEENENKVRVERAMEGLPTFPQGDWAASFPRHSTLELPPPCAAPSWVVYVVLGWAGHWWTAWLVLGRWVWGVSRELSRCSRPSRRTPYPTESGRLAREYSRIVLIWLTPRGRPTKQSTSEFQQLHSRCSRPFRGIPSPTAFGRLTRELSRIILMWLTPRGRPTEQSTSKSQQLHRTRVDLKCGNFEIS